MTQIPLKHSVWFGDKTIVVTLPPEWETTIHSPCKARALDADDVKRDLSRLVDGLKTRLPGGGGRVALIVDDISRPTPVGAVLGALLGALQRASVPPHAVSIIVAGGTHGTVPVERLREKLSDEVVANCKVIFHDPKRHLADYGKTLNSTPILVNEILGQCDLKIGIGGVFPHSPAGFGGGAKIVLGVSGFKTIAQLHYRFRGVEIGGAIDNDFRRELIEIARAVGLDSSINVVIDENREIVGLFSGDVVEAHGAAVGLARKLYSAPPPGDADLVLANTYPFDSTLLYSKKGWWPIHRSRVGSSSVIVGSFPFGLGYHGLHPMLDSIWEKMSHRAAVYARLPASFVAKMAWGKILRLPRMLSGEQKPARDVIYFRPEAACPLNRSGFCFEHSWDQVIESLKRKFSGKNPRAVVYTCAGMQYPEAISQV